jgi:hypothetical protein
LFSTIRSLIRADSDFPARTHEIDVMSRVLDGTIYDVLSYPFHQEYDNTVYVPISDRRPAVRYNLCRLVVEDSISLLFGEGRFPSIHSEDENTRNALRALVKETGLVETMNEAALKGSTGSSAILMRVLKNRVFFQVFDTRYLTPEYDPEEPDTLMHVTERYKVRGAVLAAQGYAIKPDQLQANFWFTRAWDRNTETWYMPEPVIKTQDDINKTPVVDQQRTVIHNLGFVPMVWIRNLPGGSAPDGACTFRAAIETQVELEYQLSQAGRGLRYSSDPLLMIKEPAGTDQEIVRSSSNALVVSEKGDAKLLEIGGTAAEAVIAYVKDLREKALESIHGNRTNADRLSAAQSGRALELLHQPLIWLADRLRTSYGERALLPLMQMVVAASNTRKVQIQGNAIRLSDKDPLSLRWRGWFEPTETDKQTQAATLQMHREAGHLSRETAVTSLSPVYDIEDIGAEIAKIEADEVAADEREQANMKAAAEANAKVQMSEQRRVNQGGQG